MNNKVRPTADLWSNQGFVERHPEYARDDFHESQSDSAEERAIDALAERFFSEEALFPPTLELDDERTRDVRSSDRAMRVTFVMLAVSALTLVAFLLYMRLIMPVPVELGQGVPVAVPRAAESLAGLFQPPPSAAEPNRPSALTNATSTVGRDVDLGGLSVER